MNKKPSISAVICTYKRQKSLEKTLQSILLNDRQPNEILVIDDDNLPEDFLEKTRLAFEKKNVPFVYKNKSQNGMERGLSESKNWAAKLAKGSVVAFLDDDVTVDEKYFFELEKVWTENYNDEKLIGVGGNVTNARSISFFEKLFRILFGLSSENKWDVNNVGFQVWEHSGNDVSIAYYMEGCTSSYRRELLLKMPFRGFAGGRTALEDVEHCLHAKKEGFHCLYAPSVKLEHHQLQVGRDRAFLAGWKEGNNRRQIFTWHAKKDLHHRIWFAWANVGWIIKKLSVLKFRETAGMISGLFSSKNKMKKDKKDTSKDFFHNNTVEIYDSTLKIAEAVNNFGPRKNTVFIRSVDANSKNENLIIKQHLVDSAPALTIADVCMLDGNSLKVLAVRYPSDARCVLARLAFRKGWILGLPGLLRRLILGRIKLDGIIKLHDENNKASFWLVVRRTKKTTKQERLSISKEVGTEVLFNWLKEENIKYVVPRFYETLPDLHREGGDLDLLVTNEDLEKLKNYLREQTEKCPDTNDGSIPVGLHSVSRADGLPYYPPPLAQRMIDRSVDGPAGSRIPAPEDALNSFIYHVLYHGKGYATNIPSTQGGKPETIPENDYGAVIKKKAEAVGVKVGETMEDLDDYMASVGWRPKRDTLAKIAERNAWVRDRFFADADHGGTGLTVFIVKEKAVDDGMLDKMVKHFKKDGLNIIRHFVFTDSQKKLATEHIRGGNWLGPKGDAKGLLPAAMIIATDPQCANLPPAYASDYERLWSKRRKGKLRSEFDTHGEASLVHAADNTIEAWEYIEYCLSDEIKKIREEVEQNATVSKFARARRLFSVTYISHTIKFRVRDFVTKRL